MKQDVFEWDDATQKIVEKAVEHRELDSATENLKSQAEESLDKSFHQFNFDEILRDRDTVVKSIQQVLSPRIESFEKHHEQIEERMDSQEFQADRQDNAIDWNDYKALYDNYNRLREIHSQTTIWAFVAHASSQDVAQAIDIRQMQADQNEAMKMVNEHYDKFESAADRIGRQVKDGMKDALEEIIGDQNDKLEQKEERVEELEEELAEEREKSVDVESVNPLTTRQRDLVDLVEENPGKDVDWYAEEMGFETRNVRKLETDIQNKGYRFEVD